MIELSKSLALAAAGCSLLAAGLWALASPNPIDPPVGAFAEAIMPQLKLWRREAKKAAKLNRWAAVLSGMGGFLALASVITAT